MEHRLIGGHVSNQSKRMCKEAVVACFKVIFQTLNAHSKEALGNLNVASFRARIGTRDLSEKK
jgi:hypothetical protein